MGLVLLSMFGYSVPDSAKYLVIIVLALSGGLATGFLGGQVAARGSMPISTIVLGHSVKFSVTGGIGTAISDAGFGPFQSTSSASCRSPPIPPSALR